MFHIKEINPNCIRQGGFRNGCRWDRFRGTQGYSAKGDPTIRATRRPLYDNIKSEGMYVNGKKYELSQHAYNKLFSSGRKDIMPNDIKEALKHSPVPAEENSVMYINPYTGTKVFVNPDTNIITGIYTKKFILEVKKND